MDRDHRRLVRLGARIDRYCNRLSQRVRAGGDAASLSVQHGIEYLLDSQRQDGSWEETLATGTGFPKVFYLNYHMYKDYFPLLALASYPILVEPLFTLREQTRFWTIGYAEFVLLAVGCAVFAWRRNSPVNKLFGIIAWTPLVPSTICVTCRSMAALSSISTSSRGSPLVATMKLSISRVASLAA